MFKFTREEFIIYMDDYPIFRFTPKDSKGQTLRYQYSSKNFNDFDTVSDLIVYQGENKDGYHHWIKKKYVFNVLTSVKY